MNYEPNKIYTFPILREESAGDYFTFRIETLRGPAKVTLSKFPFQKHPRYSLPNTLDCRVKSIDAAGVPELSHTIPQYVQQLHERSYHNGESIDFEIIDVPANPAESPYRIRDRFGLHYNLNERDEPLDLGQHIRCKFALLLPDRFTLKRVSDAGTFTYESPARIMEHAGVDSETAGFITRFILPMVQFTGVRQELKNTNGIWPLTAVMLAARNMREWFLHLSLSRHHRRLTALLDALKKVTLYMLEGSSYLNALPSERRRILQKQLTELVEGLRPYITTLELVATRRSDAFVEGLFDKLYRSGYLYHPSGQLATLMLIFREFPDKVSGYLNRIFESLFSRDLENWSREPFRSAFVEQLEIYIGQARRDIDAMPQAESREQKSDIETIITALALNLLLAGNDGKEEDRRRNLSLFYRYISLLRPANGADLLSKSFLALIGASINERLDYSQLREPMMMMTQATVMPAGDFMDLIHGTRRYAGHDVEVKVSSNGISVEPLVKTDVPERTIPEGFMRWLKVQVYTDGIKSISSARYRQISEHHTWWTQIENNLFNSTHRELAEDATPLREPQKDEEVYIVIDALENSYGNDPVFSCHVQHEGLTEAKGTIRRSDIIGYNLRVHDISAFRAIDGSKMGFPAIVTGRNESTGKLTFSLSERVQEYISERFNYLNNYKAVVATPTAGGYNGIAFDGVGVVLHVEDAAHYNPGDIVYFRRIEFPGTLKRDNQLHGLIVGSGDRVNDSFNKDDAFANLMRGIGEIDETPEKDDSENEVIEDVDEILGAEELREIVEIIRLRANMESDLIKAYDYLRFARILAMAMHDDDTSGKLGTHARLLSLHQYFAINRRVDTDQLEQLRESCMTDPMLQMIFHRLELVSWLGDEQHNGSLFLTANNANANELEASLARMVLSYNLLIGHGDNVDNELAGSLKNKIMEKLKVNAEIRTGKYYGSESKYLEFKTSLVFPAAAPGEPMRENPVEQQKHILSRLAGLMNASGGRLYLGVNNDGYAVGLREDFRYYERNRVSDGQFTHSIQNIDNLCVFLENLVHNAFGATVARKIVIGPDPENEVGKEVVLFQVEESLEPVLLDGNLYVRQSGQSTREYRDADAEEFRAERKRLLMERSHLARLAREEDQEQEEALAGGARTPDSVDETPAPATVNAPEPETEKPAVDGDDGKIPTSAWRPNVLHSHEDDFVQPLFYLYFSDDAVEMSHNDEYYDTDPSCRLALAVPQALADGYLILVYDEETAVKVQLSELAASGQRRFGLAPHQKLRFAALAAKDDMLVYLYKDSKDTLWRRAIAVSEIDGGQTTTVPRRIFEMQPMHGYAWEIADASARPAVEDCLIENLTGKRHGVSMRVHTYDSRTDEYVKTFINRCKPLQ